MVERPMMIEVRVPGRDIAVQPFAPAGQHPQPGVENGAGTVGGRRGDARGPYRFDVGVGYDLTCVCGVDDSVAIEVARFVVAARVESSMIRCTSGLRAVGTMRES